MSPISNLAIATDGKIVTNYSNGSNSDIITVLHSNIQRATDQVKEIAPSFKGRNDLETCRNIFDFLKNNITYSADQNSQDIKLPGRFVGVGVGDCKSYSLFTVAILNALNIPAALKYVSYDIANSTPQHVYVVANPDTKPIVIDAVNHLPFNNEKPYKHQQIYKMRIRTISGTPRQPVNGWVDDLANKFKNAGQEVIDKAKTVAFAPARGAYLLLLNINAFGFSSYLSKLLDKNPEKLKEKWNSLGGNFTELKNAINNGRNKKAIFNKNATISGAGIGEAATIATSIAAATAIIAAIAPLLAEGKKLFGTLLPGDPEAPTTNPANYVPPKPPATAKNNNLLLVSAAALAFFALK
jgi:hypothetical protein